jgi:hypothetical protein
VGAKIPASASLVLKFHARSPQSLSIGAFVQENGGDYAKSVGKTVALSPQWKEFRFVGYAPRNFAPADAQFNLFLGYDKGTVEVANLRVENFGRAPRSAFSPTGDYFGGEPQDDSWRTRAPARIEITEYDAGIQNDKVHGDYTRDFILIG